MSIVRRSNLWPSTSLFDDFLTRDLFNWSDFKNEGVSVPRVNIVESDDEFKVEMAAPGMCKEDFHVELDNDMLTIRAEVSNETEDKTYARRELSYQSFNRSFYLPNTIESEKIKAKYEDGILSLVIPKKEEARKKPVKTIAIN